MTIEQLFAATAADAKGRATSPTAGSTEWNQWLAWTNEELHAFAEAHDWPELTNHNYSLNVFFGVENPASGSTSVVFDNFNVPPVGGGGGTSVQDLIAPGIIPFAR